MTDITLRNLSGMADFFRAEALQRAVWGADDVADPADLMMVIQAEGGLAAGAFRGAELLGYIFAFPTKTPHIQHSHRLAVLASARGLGLGIALKWYQRAWCLARGITHVRWTFDPLRAANAALNIHRLGGQANTYYPDYYGEMAGINKGTASDRLLVDWHLESAGVAARAKGGARVAVAASGVHIHIPADFGSLLHSAPETAGAERARVRAAMQGAFADGHRVIDFDAARQAYVLIKD